MTSELSPRPTGGHSTAAGPEKSIWVGPTNWVVRGLLRTPLLCRAVGKRLITIYVVGRKSGRRYAVPVAYTVHDNTLLVGTSGVWARNLRFGETVDIRLGAGRRRAAVEVFTDRASVVGLYAVIIRTNRNFAKFNKIAVDTSGNPDHEDIHRVWAGGARVLRLTVTR